MARVEDPKSAEGSHGGESYDVLVGDIRITIHPSKAKRLSELPKVSSAPSDGQNVFPSMRNIDAGNQVGNDQTTRKEVGQEEENTQGRDTDRRTTMIQDEESMARSTSIVDLR